MHKTIGIIGGLSPESSVEYYLYITRSYTERFGDYGYPPVILYSVSFQSYVDWPAQDRWDLIAKGLAEAAQKLELAGAEVIVIAANTMHLVYDQVQAAVQVPVLSLPECVANEIQTLGLQTVGLLGTRFTMEKPLYPQALDRKGITVLVPETQDRAYVNKVIYSELVAGRVREESRAGYIDIIQRLISRGAQGIILGCTEIPLLVRPADVTIPLFDTTRIHAEAALRFAITE